MSGILIAEAAANTALNTFNITKASLHSANPSTTGANELISADYVRQDFTFESASGGQRFGSEPATFTLKAGDEIAWVSYWNDSVFTTARQVSPPIIFLQDGTLKLGIDTVLEL